MKKEKEIKVLKKGTTKKAVLTTPCCKTGTANMRL